ncbi:uromodulin-like [Oculina patagonica]
MTHENKQLIGHVVKRFESRSLLLCGQQCLRNAWCTSTNYKVFSNKDNKGTCELNKHEIFLINENTNFHEEKGVTFLMRLEGCLNGGSCLLDDRKQTYCSCSCKPPWTGERCEVKLECSSNPCLNGGTCIDMINGFKCACPDSLTGMHCELATDPECSTYSIDAEADRSVSFPCEASSYKCDRDTLAPGWYRFNGTAGSKMPTTCVSKNMCNTHASGWLNGAHPSLQEGVVTRTVCFHWSTNCCNWQASIKVRNCGLFYVYELVKTPNCQLRYCVTK